MTAGTAPLAPLTTEFFDYCCDAWQRSILMLDVLRERGDTYLEHSAKGNPPVLVFEHTIIVDGRKLPDPCNYALAVIKPPADCPPTDPMKRPFVVIDPRAGHGPGIGGFKMDSEIGIALRQGHPCYFVMFFPRPEPRQTIECVARAEVVFLQKVSELHPDAAGKPFVIGNCQGGWALAMLASAAPQLVGPILLAGSPLSYWAGIEGKNPMRYTGGLMGGTWLASLAGDLGNGKFDGAHLVSNFEQLDPANTYWKKSYHLYENVDTERERYLDFERWWGGHFLLNKAEMEWISQNLFVGNKLSSGEIYTSRGVHIDLRNIRSPIVVFASWGDNITPPQQALNWIPDLYQSVDDIRANEQTIVYCLHEQVGHLGIFVSAGVANKEHNELASALDLIDVLPPGLYEAIITDTSPETPGLEYLQGRYIIRFEPRDVADILELDDGRQDEAAFEVVKRIGEVNQRLYDNFVSPWLRAFSNAETAEWMRRMHPSRFERSWFSSENPLMGAVAPLAQSVREQRQPVAGDNPFWQWQQQVSDMIATSLDAWRDVRDAMQESTFKMVYESPWMAALVGLKPGGERRVRSASTSWEREEMLRLKKAELEAAYEHGMPQEGFLRLLIYVAIGNSVVDVRPFNAIRRVMRSTPFGKTVTLAELKQAIRMQTWLVRNDQERALTTLPALLQEERDRRQALELTYDLLATAGPISEEKQQRLTRVAAVLGLPARQQTPQLDIPNRGNGETQPAVEAAPAAAAKTPARRSSKPKAPAAAKPTPRRRKPQA